MAKSAPDPTHVARLLLKATESLSKRERQLVLEYLVERALLPPSEPEASPMRGARRGSLEAGSALMLGHQGMLGARPQQGPDAALIFRRLLAFGRSPDMSRVAGVSEEAVRGALQEVAADPETPERLASIFRLLADGKSRTEIAEELGISEEEVTRELQEPFRLSTMLENSFYEHAAVEKASWTPELPWFTPGPAGQQMMPVRFPDELHRRLKEWCAEHGFSMAVVVRGLVERFLDEQERRAA